MVLKVSSPNIGSSRRIQQRGQVGGVCADSAGGRRRTGTGSGAATHEAVGAGDVRASAVVRLLAAQELAGGVVVDLHLEAGRRVAMVVRADEVHVPGGGRDDTGDGVGALLHRRAGGALGDVVLGGVAANAGGPDEGADVDGWVVVLEVEAPLEVVPAER